MFWLHRPSRRQKEKKWKRHPGSWPGDTDEETARYLDCAEYSSYKQVGVLVHVQDGVGSGRAGAGRGRHHTGHRSFQRIHRYGAIQPVPADRSRRKGLDVVWWNALATSWRCWSHVQRVSRTLGAKDEWLNQAEVPLWSCGSSLRWINNQLWNLFPKQQQQHICAARWNILKTYSRWDPTGKHIWEICRKGSALRSLLGVNGSSVGPPVYSTPSALTEKYGTSLDDTLPM